MEDPIQSVQRGSFPAKVEPANANNTHFDAQRLMMGWCVNATFRLSSSLGSPLWWPFLPELQLCPRRRAAPLPTKEWNEFSTAIASTRAERSASPNVTPNNTTLCARCHSDSQPRPCPARRSRSDFAKDGVDLDYPCGTDASHDHPYCHTERLRAHRMNHAAADENWLPIGIE